MGGGGRAAIPGPGPAPAAAVRTAPRRQRRIGLTGGIATGKSTVAGLLAERFGLPVLDADLYAREALAAGSAGALAVLERYGEAVRADAGRIDRGALARIDRGALARIVFSDPAERRWLEALVHPFVRQRFAAEAERLGAAPVLVLMIPLLFEAGLEGLCTEIWLVDSDPEEQLRRLMTRDGLCEADARARIGAQWPLARKRQLADVVIDNSGAPEDLIERLEAALSPSASR